VLCRSRHEEIIHFLDNLVAPQGSIVRRLEAEHRAQYAQDALGRSYSHALDVAHEPREAMSERGNMNCLPRLFKFIASNLLI